MSVLVAVPDSPEGIAALSAAAQEAELLDTDLIAFNLGLKELDHSLVTPAVPVRVIERSGIEQRDPADAVLEEIDNNHVHRLVIGIKRRSPVGKALLGSLSQRLLLEAPVPVVAVKLREDPEP